jgi:uncharacterized Fe-S cluster-containing radical SAM superfamily protein
MEGKGRKKNGRKIKKSPSNWGFMKPRDVKVGRVFFLIKERGVQNFKISGKCDFTLQLQVIRKPILPPIVNLQNGNFYYMCKL